ncbi:hypothetical protein O181_028016 [Austropuccinia psidii MF-1]|uniref:CCHC-type domain-containing protein n=1 Tax=Austropuccinia psidii MF-1 TaxID=1389203 RepID=A0A9Q3CTM4_9BASI|nr:hypothetical protein [Austropuccinia psidii MF-1]
MSPSPARSKPPPPQLSLLMNPLPDPPDENDHMFSPQIYEDEHGFLNSTHTQTDAITLILEKINEIEKQLHHQNLPSELTTLLNRLCDKVESLAAKQSETDKAIGAILKRLDQLENQPTNKQKETNKPTATAQTPTPTDQNKFKKYSIVIRTKFGATKPFAGKTTQEAYNRVNKALMEVNAKHDNNPIRIKAIIKYPSGDVRLFTRTRAEAKWLLDNRATWTHVADPVFVTSPTSYPVIAHSCPTFLDFEDEISRNAFLHQNEIPKEKVLRIRWLGHPKEDEKSHGSIVIQLTDKITAQQLLRGGLVFDGTFMQTMPYTPGPAQCFNCLKTGHQAHMCKNDPTCIKCGEKHLPQTCDDPSYIPSIKRCIRCINADKQLNGTADKYEEKYRHSCLSQQCPIRQMEIQQLIANSQNHGE